MGIKNNVTYTEGTVEQLGESVFYGSSTVNASLWTDYPDYTYAGIITTLNSNVDFSSGDYTLFFYAKPSGQTVGSFSQLARACCQAYNVVYAEYNDDPSDMRTKIYWSKMGLSPTTSLLLQYFILKTGNTGEGSCRIVNAMPFDFRGLGMTLIPYAPNSSAWFGSLPLGIKESNVSTNTNLLLGTGRLDGPHGFTNNFSEKVMIVDDDGKGGFDHSMAVTKIKCFRGTFVQNLLNDDPSNTEESIYPNPYTEFDENGNIKISLCAKLYKDTTDGKFKIRIRQYINGESVTLRNFWFLTFRYNIVY